MLMKRDRQGNITELKNFLYRMMVLPPNDPPAYDPTWLKPEAEPTPVIGDGNTDEQTIKTLQEVESGAIGYVLKAVNGNQNHAARIRAMKRTTLPARMKKFSINA